MKHLSIKNNGLLADAVNDLTFSRERVFIHKCSSNGLPVRNDRYDH